MSTKLWIANAQARADVWWATPADAASTSWFSLTINDKTITVYAGGKDSSGTATTPDAAGIVQLLQSAIGDSPDPEWQELTATMGILYPDGTEVEPCDTDGTTLVLTGPADGKPITITGSSGTTTAPTVLITETVKGVTGRNEKQTIAFGSVATGGTFTLTFAGQTTAAVAYNIAIGDLEDALEALSNIAPGDVAVTGAVGAWAVEFLATYAQTNVPLMIGDGTSLTGAGQVDIETTTQGVGLLTNEIQRLPYSARASYLGTYRIRFCDPSGNPWYSQTFPAPPNLVTWKTSVFNANQTITKFDGSESRTDEQLLNYLTSFNDGLSYHDIEFIGEWAAVPLLEMSLQQMQPYGGAWGNVVEATEQQAGGDVGTSEVQTITVSRAVAGHFHLIFQGETTGAITYSAVPATLAANIDTALEALTGIGAGNVAVTVSGSTSVADIFLATFGGDLAGVDVEQMTADATSLTGGTVLVNTTTAAIVDVNEVQTISLPGAPTSGTFTLSFGAYTTTALTFDESAADIDTALEALTSIGAGQVAVTGSAGGSWTVTFGGTLAATDVAAISGSGYGLVIAGTQSLDLSRMVERRYAGGSWVQSTRVFTPGGAVNPVSEGVAVGDAACVFADAEIGGAAYMARVSARDTTTITLRADAIEGTPPGNGTSDTTLLIVTDPTGPNFWDAADNWSSGTVPADTDAVVFESSSEGCLYNLNQATVTPATITVKASFTGDIGLPVVGEYHEYRPTYLRICDSTDSATTTIEVGRGDGSGSGRIKIDSGAAQTILKVYGTGSPQEADLPAVIWKGTHVSNTVEVQKGSVGVAIFSGEAAAVATLTVGWDDDQGRDADVTIGAGCTTIATIAKTGGVLDLSAGFTVLVQEAGETHFRTGAAGTITLDGGKLRYYSGGNYTAMNVYAAEADFSPADSAVTGTNTTLYRGYAFIDPNKRITFTNPTALKCRIADGTLDLGNALSLQRS